MAQVRERDDAEDSGITPALLEAARRKKPRTVFVAFPVRARLVGGNNDTILSTHALVLHRPSA